MRCLIKEILSERDMSIRKFAEEWQDNIYVPNYSTIDNFIRKGTGNLETAWTLTRMLGVTLDDVFVADDNEPIPSAADNVKNPKQILNDIISIMVSRDKIKSIDNIAGLLFEIAELISHIGYEKESAKIIDMANSIYNIRKGAGDNE